MWLLYIFIALAVAGLAQNVLVRSRLVGNPLLAFLASGVFLGLWLIATLFHGYGASVAVAGTLLFAFLSEFYIFLFSLAYSSVSANLLRRLLGRSMNREAIDRLYDDNSMIAERLRGLTQIGLLARANGQVLATRNGKRVAAIFTAIRSFFDHN